MYTHCICVCFYSKRFPGESILKISKKWAWQSGYKFIYTEQWWVGFLENVVFHMGGLSWEVPLYLSQTWLM